MCKNVCVKKKVHRGTLHEMVKNDANKCAKQIETNKALPSTITSPTSSVSNRQQCGDIVDNRHVTSISNRSANKYTEVQQPDECDNDAGKPLSKMDLIKKFDSKYKQSEQTIDNKASQLQRASFHEETQKTNVIPDEVENDENIQNSNNEEINDVEITRDAESTSVANNNYKNGNNTTYGSNANANGNDSIPPKPLPRTSRNNSVSSLSSEQSVSISSNPIEECNVRPVAKPRTTTTTSYKVQHFSDTSFDFFFVYTNSFVLHQSFLFFRLKSVHFVYFLTRLFISSCGFSLVCVDFFFNIFGWFYFYIGLFIGFGFIFCVFCPFFFYI